MFWWKSFHMPVRKRRQKGWRVSDFALSLVVFKWHHGSGSERVNELGHSRSRDWIVQKWQPNLAFDFEISHDLIISDNPVSEPSFWFRDQPWHNYRDNPVSEPSFWFRDQPDLIISDNPVSEPSFWFRDQPWPNYQWWPCVRTHLLISRSAWPNHQC